MYIVSTNWSEISLNVLTPVALGFIQHQFSTKIARQSAFNVSINHFQMIRFFSFDFTDVIL